MSDAVKNFAKSTVSTGYDAAATSIVLSGGGGAKFPATPFNVVWWNSTDYSDPSDDPNVEIVRVTAISTDTLTVTRAQESTGASTKNTGGKTYTMIQAPTALSMTQKAGLADANTFTAANVFSSTLACGTIYGGSAAGSTLNLQSTSNGSPSGDKVTITAGGSVRQTNLGSGNIGFANETNPAQSQVVFGLNATAAITLAGVTTNGAMLFGPDNTGSGYGYHVTTFGGAALNQFMRGNNTVASLSALASADIIGGIVAGGYAGITAGWTASTRARFLAIALENWSNTNQGAGWQIDTVAAGGTTRAQAARVMGGVVVGSGTTDPGAGCALLTPQTFGSLSAAGSTTKGRVACVSDSTTTTWGATITGGGANVVLAFDDGTNWTVAGK